MEGTEENDFEENREILGPMQSLDGTAADLAGLVYLGSAGGDPVEVV